MSGRYFMEIPIHVHGQENIDELENQIDAVLEALLVDSAVIDPDAGGSLARGQITFTMSVEADDDLEAMSTGLVHLRSAIHATGGATPDWAVDTSKVHLTRLEALV